MNTVNSLSSELENEVRYCKSLITQKQKTESLERDIANLQREIEVAEHSLTIYDRASPREWATEARNGDEKCIRSHREANRSVWRRQVDVEENNHSWDELEDVVNARLANEKPMRAVIKRMAALDSYLKERVANKYKCFLKTRTIPLLLFLHEFHQLHWFHFRRHVTHNDMITLILHILSVILPHIPYDKTLIGHAISLVSLRLTLATLAHLLLRSRDLHMIGVRRRVLAGSPHEHDGHEKEEVEQAPDAVVDATAHAPPLPLTTTGTSTPCPPSRSAPRS